MCTTSEQKKYRDDLLKAIKDSSPLVRISALNSLYIAKPEESLEPAIQLLNDKTWPVQTTAIDILSKLHKKESIEPLIIRLAKEKGRLRYDIVQALQDISSRSLGYNAKDWKIWFDANKDKFKIEPKGLKTMDDKEKSMTIAVPRFFEVPIFGKNIIFIIDFSGSMKTEVKSEGKRRIDIAQEQLAQALNKFNSNQFYYTPMKIFVK